MKLKTIFQNKFLILIGSLYSLSVNAQVLSGTGYKAPTTTVTQVSTSALLTKGIDVVSVKVDSAGTTYMSFAVNTDIAQYLVRLNYTRADGSKGSTGWVSATNGIGSDWKKNYGRVCNYYGICYNQFSAYTAVPEVGYLGGVSRVQLQVVRSGLEGLDRYYAKNAEHVYDPIVSIAINTYGSLNQKVAGNIFQSIVNTTRYNLSRILIKLDYVMKDGTKGSTGFVPAASLGSDWERRAITYCGYTEQGQRSCIVKTLLRSIVPNEAYLSETSSFTLVIKGDSGTREHSATYNKGY